jgi:F420-dependent methylenetetrahydromethanopterin dehydrogenase
MPGGGQIEMGILVAFEEAFRAYRDGIAAGIRIFRPRAEVETASLEALGECIERFDPELVICTRPNSVDPGGRPAWVEISVDPTQPSKFCVGGRYSESINPTLELLLAVIDEVEELVQTNTDRKGC